jgi:hypothetical protein
MIRRALGEAPPTDNHFCQSDRRQSDFADGRRRDGRGLAARLGARTLKIVRFPVCCPLCRQEVLGARWIWEIDSALTEEGALSLHAPCHGIISPETEFMIIAAEYL